MSMPTTAPRVYLIEDLCEALKVSRSVVERLRRHGTFPIPELPALDRRPRWSAEAVDRFLSEQGQLPRRLRRVR
jgi:hypothetical protein